MFSTRVINYHGKDFEQRAAIKFCCKAGFTTAKMWEMFVKVFGDSSVLHAKVFDGIARLWCMRSRLKMRSGAEGWEQ